MFNCKGWKTSRFEAFSLANFILLLDQKSFSRFVPGIVLESESRTPNIRKSRSPNVSCEVSHQIGLIIRSKPYSSGSSLIKVFALGVAPPRFKSTPAQLFYFYFFKKVVKVLS